VEAAGHLAEDDGGAQRAFAAVFGVAHVAGSAWVERIVLADGDLSIEASHGPAPGCATAFMRKKPPTDGLARLPESWLHPFPRRATLDVHLIPTDLRYRLPPPFHSIAAA